MILKKGFARIIFLATVLRLTVLYVLLLHLANGFTKGDMAQMLGVSLRTIENRFSDYSMTNRDRYSATDDEFLDAYVERAVALFSISGKHSFLVRRQSFTYYQTQFVYACVSNREW